MATTKKNDTAANLSTCATGITASYPATQSWVFNGKTYQRADILSLLQASLQAAQTTKTSHDTWSAAVEAEKAQLALLHPVLGALKKALESQWGATSNKMAEFGFVPAKPQVKTAATKAASAAKARVTRAAKKAALATVKTPAPASTGGPTGTSAGPGTPAAAVPQATPKTA